MSRDLIDRQEILDRLDRVIIRGVYDDFYEGHLLTAEVVKETILSLPPAEPDLQPTCNQLATDTNVPCKDTISRQSAIDMIMGQPPEAHYPSWYAEKIKALPSAQPESCGDVISKEYLKEHIEACWINGRPRYAPELNEVLSWIDDVPTIKPESKWIPCSERLPSDSDYYLVTDAYGDMSAIWFAHEKDYYGESEWRETEDEIIAWMPLPEPYKGEGVEE